jgi:ribosome-binding protein aMBF1 (putative translation factor)
VVWHKRPTTGKKEKSGPSLTSTFTSRAGSSGTASAAVLVGALDIQPETFHHTPITHEFKQALQTARLTKGLSQQALAARLHVTEREIRDYELGVAVPRGTLIDKLNRELGVCLPRLPKAKHGEAKAVNH